MEPLPVSFWKADSMICRICSNSEANTSYRIREMMYGLGDEFTYFECSECGCLQIADIPDSMDRYYPDDYLRRFQTPSPRNRIQRFLRTQGDRYALFGKGLVGRIVGTGSTDPNNVLGMIARARPGPESRILDIGCGSGEFLYRFRDAGMKDVHGIDPYAANEVRETGLTILRRTVRDLDLSEGFDLIVLHHSFEHIPEQEETLSRISRLLTPSGTCAIRMPLKTDAIWSRYGTDWVQIDAPRHFYLHTMKSFRLLAGRANLAIKNVVFDSWPFQFWGSEQLRKGIPLLADNSYAVSPDRSIFTPSDIRAFREMAIEANQSGEGDQATFYLVAGSH